jgi:hypothetical protein
MYLLFHNYSRQETNILSPEGLSMSNSDVILNSKRQNLDLLKYSFLKILAFINVRLFRLKMCPKKVAQ